MPHEPMRAAEALSRLQVAQTCLVEAQEERRRAILETVRADVPLREVAREARCSHETIRRIVAAGGAITLEFRARGYPMPGQTVELLIYKLAGNARGTFARDVGELEAGTNWLAAAGLLAEELHAAASSEDGKSVRLDEPRAFALHQVLRFTASTRPSTLARLSDVLSDRYGFPPYSPRLLRRWTTIPQRGSV
jgi:hypothetical protein